MVTRARSVAVSRWVILVVVSASLASFFRAPSGVVEHLVDILVRAYLFFIAGAMAHEGTHGHLGNSKAANAWWGRLALLPTTVPYLLLRKTHHYHHQHTNIAGRDPDAFLNAPRWQVPFRALLMPHYWLVWLHRNGKLSRADVREYLLTHLAYALVYGAIMSQVGVIRFVMGLIPSTIVHAYLLWYPFAIKTHEGYSTGTSESRSHNYYGALPYWFSCGLALHRLHHQKPNLAWLQMASFIERSNEPLGLRFRRDVRRDTLVA